MILFGCLLAFSAAVAPRVILILAWLFSDRWDLVWQGDIVVPLLGIIFLPYTTIMYLLTWTLVGGIEGWDWMWIILGLFLDFMKWSQMIANRKEATRQTQKYAATGASGDTASATVAAAPAATTTETSAAPADPVPSPAPEPTTVAPAADRAKLDELEQMRASGALTDEEYDAAKAKLEG